jgi:predicted nuclease of restriction endonuclease-like RecB superfamily
MSIRTLLKEIIDLLSEINDAPAPPATLLNGLKSYGNALTTTLDKLKKNEKWLNLMAELVNNREDEAKRKLDHLSDGDFKVFCEVNKIKVAKGKAGKMVKGKIIQKKVAAKPARGKKLAQPAIPEMREPDTIIPAVTARQATTEAILNRAVSLKNQATI